MYECSFEEREKKKKRKKRSEICKPPQQSKKRKRQAPYWRQSNKHMRWQLNRYLPSSDRKYNFTLCWAVISLQRSLCWAMNGFTAHIFGAFASSEHTDRPGRSQGRAFFFLPPAPDSESVHYSMLVVYIKKKNDKAGVTGTEMIHRRWAALIMLRGAFASRWSDVRVNWSQRVGG